MSRAPASAAPSPRVEHPRRLAIDALPPGDDELSYSVRRYFVDEFYLRHVAALPQGAELLDVGGLKGKKRGRFDVASFPLRVTCANVNPAANPDILCDACAVPCPDSSFDAVILAEVVEHLPDAPGALAEAARLLRPGGVLLATAPFMFRVHADPIDVARYTPQWWDATLAAAGFALVTIERQGQLFSVMAELLRGWVYYLEGRRKFWPGTRETAISLVRWARRQAIRWEGVPAVRDDAYYSSFSLGYGVVARKAGGA